MTSHHQHHFAEDDTLLAEHERAGSSTYGEGARGSGGSPRWTALNPFRWKYTGVQAGSLRSISHPEQDDFDETGFVERPNHPSIPFSSILSWVKRKPRQSTTSPDAKASWRLTLAYYFDSTTSGRYLELIDALLNFFYCGLYIGLTVLSKGKRNQIPFPCGPSLGLIWLDFWLACGLFLLWLIMMALSLSPIKGITHPISYLTLLATIPVIWNACHGAFGPLMGPVDPTFCNATFLSAKDLIYLYPFRFWRLNFSLSRLLRAGRHSILPRLSPVLRKSSQLSVRIICTLITVSAWVHICLYIIQRYYDVTYPDVFYSISVSATSGLSTSDIIPDNPFSRAIILFVMICGAIFVPTQLAELLALIRSQPKYALPYYPVPYQQHILIVGVLEADSLMEILAEFYCLDHGPSTLTTQVAVLSPGEPSDEIRQILQDPLYVNRVFYINGTAMSWRDLRKANTSTAKACFVLGGQKGSTDEDTAGDDDTHTIMRTLSIKKFRPSMRIFAQVNMASSKAHLDQLTTLSICTEELRLGMVAQSIRCRGFSALFHMLTTSPVELTDNDFVNAPQWKREYFHGSVHEIYVHEITPSFVGLSFAYVSEFLYLKYSCLFFAISIPTIEDSDVFPASTGKVLLFPSRYIVRGGETAFFIGTQHAKVSEYMRAEELSGANRSGPDLPALSPLTHLTELEEAAKDIKSVRSELGTSDFSLYSMEPQSLNSPSLDMLTTPASTIGSVESVTLQSKNESQLDHNQSHSLALLPLWITGHVVVMGDSDFGFPSNFEYFLAPLRRTEPRYTVVVLSTSSPSPAQWDRLSAFKGQVYHVLGSPVTRSDLHKVHIKAAIFAVILSHPSPETRAYRVADASALLSHMNVEYYMSEVPYFTSLTEFIHPENMKFVGKGKTFYEVDRNKQKIVPAFVSGQVIYRSMFDSLLIQSFYNENLVSILKEMIFMTRGLSSTQSSGLPESSHLAQFAMPKDGSFNDASYSVFFSHCVRLFRCLPLGLYRTERDGVTPVHYVVVNPPHATKLREDDLVFALRMT